MKNALSVGETVTYAITMNLIQGTTPSLVFTDVLPAGLSYVSHTIVAGNQGITVSNSNYAQRLGSGQTVSFDFGTVANPANGVTTDDFGTVLLTVRVDNVAANQDGTVLSNGENVDGSEVFVTFGAGPTRVDFDADGATPGNQGRPLTVVEPVATDNQERTSHQHDQRRRGADPGSRRSGDVQHHDRALRGEHCRRVRSRRHRHPDEPDGHRADLRPGLGVAPAPPTSRRTATCSRSASPRCREPAGSTTFTYQARIGENAPTLTTHTLCNGAAAHLGQHPGRHRRHRTAAGPAPAASTTTLPTPWSACWPPRSPSSRPRRPSST